ncbi:hypothetical protein V6N13_072177 [Hibiscus sabdariffa]
MRDGRREGMLPVKKLVVGPRGGSAGPPHDEHRSARPYCRRCAPGLNWSGRSSGAIDGPPTRDEPAEAHAPVSNPVAPAVAAPVAKPPSAPVAETDADNLRSPLAFSEAVDLVEDAVDDPLDQENSKTAADRSTPEDAPYDPMVHTETSDMLEEALEISRDYILLADLTGVIQANGEDLVNEAIPEAVDSIILDVAASILGASASAAATVVSSRPSPTPVASPPNPGHSSGHAKSARCG